MPSRSLPRAATLIVAATLLASGLAACGGASDNAADDGTITIYSGRNEQLVAPILAAFTAETGIATDVRYGDSAELAAQILEEGDKSRADVFFSQDAGALGAVSNDGLLGELPATAISAVPEKYRDPTSTWTGVTGRARVIVYDSDKIAKAEAPTSVFELTDPKYKGQVAIAPTNASFQAFVTAMRLSEGEETTKKWLEDIAANDPQVFDNNNLILEAIDQGDVEVGLLNHYYWYQKAAEIGADKMRAQISWPQAGDPGGLVNVAGVGVLNGSIDDPDAVAFVEFLLAKKTQELFVKNTKEYALVPGVAQAQGLRPLDSLKGPDVALSDLASLPATLALLEDVGLT